MDGPNEQTNAAMPPRDDHIDFLDHDEETDAYRDEFTDDEDDVFRYADADDESAIGLDRQPLRK